MITVDAKRLANSPCGYSVKIDANRWLGRNQLPEVGINAAIPWRLRHDGGTFEDAGWRTVKLGECTGSQFLGSGIAAFSSLPGHEPGKDDIPAGLRVELGDFPIIGHSVDGGRRIFWLPPGSRGTWSFDERWNVEERGPFAVSVVMHRASDGAGLPTMSVAGHRTSLHAIGDKVGARFTPPVPDAGFELQIDVPEDGGWYLLNLIALGVDDDALALVGSEHMVDKSVKRIVGGHGSTHEASFPARPPPFPDWIENAEKRPPLFVPGPGRRPVVQGPDGIVLRDDRILLEKKTGFRIYWLYPGDVITLTETLEGDAPEGWSSVLMIGDLVARGRRNSRIELEVSQGGKKLGAGSLVVRRLEEGAVFNLDEPIVAGGEPVVVRVESPPDAPFIKFRSLAVRGPSVWQVLSRPQARNRRPKSDGGAR